MYRMISPENFLNCWILRRVMLRPECSKKTKVSRIKFEERGRIAIFVNPDRAVYLRVRIDDCEITTGSRADWLIRKGDADVVLELKGRDVDHALDQVVATARYLT